MIFHLRTVLLLIQFGLVLSLAPNTQAQDLQQCAKIDCRCNGLRNDWGQACQAQENELKDQCQKSAGKISNYCRWQGAGAFPTVLKSFAAPTSYSVDQLTQAQTAFQSKLWSMQQDFASSQELYGQGKIKSVATLAKRVDKQAASAISQGIVLMALYRQLENEESRSTVVSDLRGALADQENRFLAWSDAIAEQGKLKMARRFTRYSGNMAESQGLLFDALNEHDAASKAWQRAAQRAEQLLGASKKPRIWKYYRAQAASRYAKAASAERRGNGSVQSLVSQANALWQLSQPSPAKPE